MPRGCAGAVQDEVRAQEHKVTPLIAFGDVSSGRYFIRKPPQPSTGNEHPGRRPAQSFHTALAQRVDTRVLASGVRQKPPEMADAAVQWGSAGTTSQCCQSVKAGNVVGPRTYQCNASFGEAGALTGTRLASSLNKAVRRQPSS